jgi:hypothetical protein
MDIEQFYKYKLINIDLLPELRSYANDMSYQKNNRNNKGRYNNNRNNNNNRNGNYDNNRNNNYNNRNNFDNKPPPSILTNHTNDKKKFYIDINGVLNKLAENNFDDIFKYIKDIQIDTDEKKSVFVEQLFKKAVNELKFTHLYVRLCIETSKLYENEEKTKFRQMLLNKCQSMFTEATSFETIEEFDQAKFFKSKNSINGCIIFIAAMYNQSLLTYKIMEYCFSSMISNVTSGKYYILDLICLLMTNIGKKFCKECKNYKEYLNKIDDLKNLDNITTKDKYTIMDLLEKIK